MPLTVLSSPATALPADLVRLFHQSQLDWSRHLGEETTLDAGIWISNPALTRAAEANCFMNVRLLPGVGADDLVDEMHSRSLAVAAPCRRWTLNPSAPPEQTVPLAQHLLQAGWRRSTEDILILPKQRSSNHQLPDLTVIPARASFGLYRRLMHLMIGDSTDEALDAAMLHLDDSHFDAVLAIQDKDPIASIGVLTSGEVGTLRHWFVDAPHRRGGIGRLMLNRILDICGRAGFRHVMTAVPASSLAVEILKATGFEKIGEWVFYSAP